MYQTFIRIKENNTYLAKAEIFNDEKPMGTLFLSFGGEVLVDLAEGVATNAELNAEVDLARTTLKELYEQHMSSTALPYYEIKGKKESYTGWFDPDTGDTSAILVHTEQGIIKAEVAGDSSYPGIYLSFIDPNAENPEFQERVVGLLEFAFGEVSLKVWEDESKNESYDHKFTIKQSDDILGCQNVYNRVFKRPDGKAFRLCTWGTDMDELMVDLSYDNGRSGTEEESIASCTIYYGMEDQEEIGEKFDEVINAIEGNTSSISDLIELMKDFYLTAEGFVPLDIGWRGPGDETGECFECNWTEEDDHF